MRKSRSAVQPRAAARSWTGDLDDTITDRQMQVVQPLRPAIEGDAVVQVRRGAMRRRSNRNMTIGRVSLIRYQWEGVRRRVSY